MNQNMFFKNKRKLARKMMMLMLVMTTLGAHADDVTYNYLVMKDSSGTLTPLSVVELCLTFSDGKLHATCADGSRSFTLSSLASMYFSENAPTTGIAVIGDANVDGQGEIDIDDINMVINIILEN